MSLILVFFCFIIYFLHLSNSCTGLTEDDCTYCAVSYYNNSIKCEKCHYSWFNFLIIYIPKIILVSNVLILMKMVVLSAVNMLTENLIQI